MIWYLALETVLVLVLRVVVKVLLLEDERLVRGWFVDESVRYMIFGGVVLRWVLR